MPRKPAKNPHGLFTIEGDCLRPRSFSYLDLKEIHSDYQVDDLSLVDERLSGVGVRLRKLIDIAGPGYGCEYMTVESADGEFAASLPLGEISRTAVLVYEKGGAPLERDDGGPVRFVVPYHPDNCVNVKGLGRILISKTPGRDTRPSQKDETAGSKV
ncbi:MAG: molybdopterin-dependent oxidoreductase [Planctomycetota bacterium]|jgi:2-dehydropantoate 2-reductase